MTITEPMSRKAHQSNEEPFNNLIYFISPDLVAERAEKERMPMHERMMTRRRYLTYETRKLLLCVQRGSVVLYSAVPKDLA
jgi:hypothetical protein